MGLFSKFFGNKKETATIKNLGKLAFLEVDMHNHLLPGIDDGSKDVNQSLFLIQGLENLGIQRFICTPHIMDGIHPNTKSTIFDSYKSLEIALTEKNSKSVIHPAAEHMIDEGLESLIKKDNLCVMPGNYVLIEMSYLSESKALFQTIFDIQNLGYKPILAHPERYNYYHYNFDMYKQIKDSGCLLQLNLLALSRYYGTEVKVAALTLLKSGMYDFVGTDLHHNRHLLALEDIVAKYPIRDMLKTSPIKNASLLDYLTSNSSTAVG